MEIKVKLNNLRVAPRKARYLVDLVRGKRAAEAQSILSFTVSKTAEPVLKLLNSGIASAKNDFHLDESNLFISKITVDEGPKLKRWHPMSRGRAYPIMKRTSHIALVLAELNPTAKKEEIKPEVKKEANKSEKPAKVVKTQTKTNSKKRNPKPKAKKA